MSITPDVRPSPHLGPPREETLRGARRLRAVIEHVERAATYDPDPLRRESATRWLEALVDPASVPPIPRALTPRSPDGAPPVGT